MQPGSEEEKEEWAMLLRRCLELKRAIKVCELVPSYRPCVLTTC